MQCMLAESCQENKQIHNYTVYFTTAGPITSWMAGCKPWRCSQKEDDACVGHGVRQTQDAAAHDGVTEVEDRHSEGGFTFKLPRHRTGRLSTRGTKATYEYIFIVTVGFPF